MTQGFTNLATTSAGSRSTSGRGRCCTVGTGAARGDAYVDWGSRGRRFESSQPDHRTAGQSRSERAGSCCPKRGAYQGTYPKDKENPMTPLPSDGDAQTTNRVVSGVGAAGVAVTDSDLEIALLRLPAAGDFGFGFGSVGGVPRRRLGNRPLPGVRSSESADCSSSNVRSCPASAGSGVSPCSTDLSRTERAKSSSGLRRTTTSPGLRRTTRLSPSGDASTDASRLMPWSSHQRSSQASMSGRTVVHRSQRVQR